MIHRRHCCNTMRGRDDHAPAADRYREEYKARAGSEMQRETEHPPGGVAAGTSWLNVIVSDDDARPGYRMMKPRFIGNCHLISKVL